jgi:hypothetical protein
MKIIRNILGSLLLGGLLCTSCTGNFEELNTDPTRLQDANPGTFLDPILYGMATTNWNKFNSHTFTLMQCKISMSNTSGVGWYYMSDAAGDGTWTTYYKWLNNIREMEDQAETLNEPNYKAIALTLKGWIYGLLADSFGDVPMTEACRGDEKIYTPKFDTQKEVYQAIINELDSANQLFVETSGLKYNTGGEMMYGTDNTLVSGKSAGILKWKKFCNSLRMRTLLRVLNVDGLNAKAELVKMISNPTTYPVFQSNDDAAKVYITGVAPEEAPLTRPADYTSYICLSEFFINNLSALKDPRLPLFAKTATNGTVKSYIGWPSGYDIAPSFNASIPNVAVATAPMNLMLMNYAEVEFIKAELALKGIITDDAKTHYENGVKAAITQWGGVVPTTYFDNTKAAYDGTMERIMLQKFFALIFCDYQQWFEYNRTLLPVMPVGKGVPQGNEMPRRFKYPASLQRTNLINYQAAKSSMGGDDFNVKLIWQK